MKVLIATDKFKGSLSAGEACMAMRDGVLKRYPDAEIDMLPLADGGEGTTELLAQLTKGRFTNVRVSGPLFEKLDAGYGLSGDGLTAFIESAKASGLQLLEPSKRNPLHTTTLGTGELIAHAISNGAKTVMLGIGGTATNDAGVGMASALGFLFFDNSGKSVEPVGRNLLKIASIDRSKVDHAIDDARFIALCDVDNPLYGPRGAAYIYGPQKGGSPEDVEALDLGLRNFETVVRRSLGLEADFAGAGAGGGLASGAKVFLGASVRRAMDYISELTGLEEKIKSADLIITGEGKIDTQTLSGKVVGTVAQLAARHNKRVIAVCGVCELREIELNKIGISKVISLTDPFTDSGQAMTTARRLIVAKLRTEA